MRPLHHHHLPMVGTAPSLDIRQPANDALPWLWLLRLLVHDSDSWQPSRRYTLLLYTFQSHGMGQPGRGNVLAHRCNYHRGG